MDSACNAYPTPTDEAQNKAFDAEPPIASFLKSMFIGGGPVNAGVIPH